MISTRFVIFIFCFEKQEIFERSTGYRSIFRLTRSELGSTPASYN